MTSPSVSMKLETTMRASEAPKEGLMARLKVKTLYSGWWHWIVTIASAAEFFIILGFLQNYSILFVSLQEEFGSTAALTGWPSSLTWSLTFLGSPLNAVILQRITNRTMILLGQCIMCTGIVMTSFVPAVEYVVLTFGVVVGIGISFVNHAGTVVVLNWFTERDFVRANAIVTMGSSIGMVVFSRVLTVSFERIGWRASLRLIAVGCLTVSIAFGFFLTEPPPKDKPRHQGKERAAEDEHESEQISEDPEDPTDETSTMNKEDPDNERGNIQIETVKTTGRQCCPCRWEVCHMMRCLDPWLWTFALVLAMFGWTFFTINFASFLEGRGLSKDQTSVVIMLFATGDIGGKILIAIVGNRLPVKEIYCVSAAMLVGTVAFGFMTIVQTFTDAIILAIATGVIRSILYGTTSAIAADIFPWYSPNGVTTLAMFPYGLGALLSAPVSGGLYDATGNYLVSLVVISTSFVFSSVLFIFIPIRRRLQSRGLWRCSTVTQTPTRL